MSNPYDEDEYYDDEDCDEDDYEPSEWSFDSFLCKAPNGHLFVEEVTGWKYRGQDWGETVGQWETKRIRIRDLRPELQPVALRIGRGLQPGKAIDCHLLEALQEEESEDEHYA